MTTVYSKFIAPLPPKAEQFLSSMASVFPHVIDFPLFLNKTTKRRTPLLFSPPITMELHPPVPIDECTSDGLHVIKMAHFFAKILSAAALNSGCSTPPTLLRIRAGRSKMVGSRMVFLWPLKPEASSPVGVKRLILEKSGGDFGDGLEVQMVDRSCAVAVLSEAEKVNRIMEVNEYGVNTAGYDVYRKACCLYQLEKNEGDLAEYLDRAVSAAAEPVEVSMDGGDEDDGEDEDDYNEFIVNFDDL